jgi:hypothetical protein
MGWADRQETDEASLLYTPRDEGERAVCYALFAESYNFACKLVFTDSSQPF